VRLSDLLDHAVVDEHGHRLGVVHEVRLVQDGPPGDGVDHTFRLHGLDLGRGGLSRRLGYARDVVRGPWLLRVLFARGAVVHVPWDRVRSLGDVITISGDGRDLERHPNEDSG
jgi:sporulation protein YlmC with PRC-barrel domain